MTDQNEQAIPVAHMTQNGEGVQMSALYNALAAAQGEFGAILKNRNVKIQMKSGGAYNFRYADLEEITAKTRPALSKHGLATTQIINPSTIARSGGSGLSVFTTLMHKDGASLVSEIEIPGYSNELKLLGAAISYLRRYAKSSLLDVAADDDLDESSQQADESGGDQQPAEVKRVTSTKAADSEKPSDGSYPDALFEKNLRGWTAAITTRKSTAETVIRMAKTKGALSEKQIAILNDIKPAQESAQ